VNAPAPKLDPVRFEVIRNALVEVAEETGLTRRRSAYSTNIKTRADFSCVIFDADLRFLASNFAQATHLGSMYQMVPRIL
jgi:N-methylhydantoinase B/oxoprolinase/acetone carboxylase alpha subunit